MAKFQNALVKFVDRFIWSKQAELDESRILDVLVDPWTKQYGIEKPTDIESFGKVYQYNENVYTCVKVIAEASNDVKLKVYEQKTVKGKQTYVEVENTTNPIRKLFMQVNGRTTENEFKEHTISSLELQGNSYWWIVRNSLNIPSQMYFMRPDYVTIIPDTTVPGGVKGYVFGRGDRKENFDVSEILHFKYFNPRSQFYGQSPIQAAKVTIEADIYAKLYNKQFFINSARPYGVLKSKVNLDKASRKRLKKMWASAHQGADKAYRTALLEGDLDYKQLGISQKDSDFIQQLKMYREVIMSIFKVPPAMMDIYEYANYANAKEQRKIFWTDVMTKKLNKIAGYINEFLLFPIWGTKYKVLFDYSDIEVLRESENEKIERLAKAINAGMLDPAYARELMSWPVEGTFYLPMNMLTIGSTSKESKNISNKSIDTEMAKNLNRTREQGISRLRSDYNNALSDMFKHQGMLLIEAIKDKINELKPKAVKEQLPRLDVEVLWTEGKFGQMIIDVSIYFMGQFMERGIETATNLTGIETAFGIDHPSLANSLDNMLNLLSDRTSIASKEDLRKIITAGIENNTTIDGMTREIRKEVSAKWGDFAKYRAERIARTEASSAYGEGSHQYYKEVGVKYHRWLTMNDGLVADICMENQADGIIPINEAFSSGQLHEPGHINCRCSVVPVTEEE